MSPSRLAAPEVYQDASWAGITTKGSEPVAIWHSREECERFLQQMVMPMAQQIGLPPFEPQFLPVDNVLTR